MRPSGRSERECRYKPFLPGVTRTSSSRYTSKDSVLPTMDQPPPTSEARRRQHYARQGTHVFVVERIHKIATVIAVESFGRHGVGGSECIKQVAVGRRDAGSIARKRLAGTTASYRLGDQTDRHFRGRCRASSSSLRITRKQDGAGGCTRYHAWS